MARIDSGSRHQFLFVGEVVDRVLEQMGEDAFEFPGTLRLRLQLPNPVDDADEFLVLPVDDGFTGEEAIIPDEGIHRLETGQCWPNISQ